MPKLRLIPTRLRIGHATFKLKPSARECEAMGTNGHFGGDARRIVYAPGLSADLLREVLVHETLHAAIYVSGVELADLLNMTDRDPKEVVAVEEQLVAALTGPLLTLIRDNPEFVALLQD